VDDYRHEGATRLNVPEVGIATQDRSVAEKVTYEYDPHLDPQLVWAGKAEHTSFEVDRREWVRGSYGRPWLHC